MKVQRLKKKKKRAMTDRLVLGVFPDDYTGTRAKIRKIRIAQHRMTDPDATTTAI